MKPEKNPVKLDTEDVLEMRRLFKLGWTNREIAKRFDVSPNMVSMIKSGVRWKKAA